jgi:mannosyltransferase
LSWPDLVRVLGQQDMNFAPYYAFMHVWTQASTQLWWMRLPSAVGAAVAVVAVTGLTRYLFNAKAAWLAALLTVLSVSWIAFAQEARPYSWAAAIATLATWVFVTLCDRVQPRRVVLYLLLMALLPLAHLFAVMVGGVHFLFAAARRDRRMSLLSLAGLVPGVIVGVLLSTQVKQVTQTVPTALGAVRDVAGMSGLTWYVPVAILALAGLVVSRRGLAGDRNWADVVLFASWWICPPAILWVLSVTVTPVFATRYFLWTVPAMIIPAAALLERIIRGLPTKPGLTIAARAAVILVLAGLVVAMVPKQIQVRSASGHFWQAGQMAETILRSRGPSDALIAPEYGVRFPVEYHLRSVDLPQPLATVSARDVGRYDPPAAAIAEEPARLASYSRVWVLSTPGKPHRIPDGFCEQESWMSKFQIAQLTLAARC